MEKFRASQPSHFYKRGEIYWIELDPTRGTEIRKTRPCLIISNNEQNEISRRVMAVPLTSRKLPPSSFHVDLVLKSKSAKILPEQMRVVDKSRIKGYYGKVSSEVLKKVARAIHIILDLED